MCSSSALGKPSFVIAALALLACSCGPGVISGADVQPTTYSAPASGGVGGAVMDGADIVWLELRVGSNSVLRNARQIDYATLRAALAASGISVAGASAAASAAAPVIVGAVVIVGVTAVIYVALTAEGSLQRDGPHIVREDEVRAAAAAAGAAGMSIYFARLEDIDASSSSPRRCKTSLLDQLNHKVTDKCKGQGWNANERDRNYPFWKRQNSCFHEARPTFAGACSPLTNRAKRLLECLRARAERRTRCYGGKADARHAAEWKKMLDFYFSCYDKACYHARSICGAHCRDLLDEGDMLFSGAPLPLPAPEPQTKTYRCGAAHGNRCFIDSAQRARFADAGYGCLEAHAKRSDSAGNTLICTYSSGLGYTWSACLRVGGLASSASSSTSADSYGTLRKDSAGRCRRCYHHPDAPTSATAWRPTTCPAGASPAAPSPPPPPPPPPSGTPHAPTTCSATSCCATLADDSKLVPAKERTFDGVAARDNFCFIADQASCCYRTHCGGDWTAGYQAARVCAR